MPRMTRTTVASTSWTVRSGSAWGNHPLEKEPMYTELVHGFPVEVPLSSQLQASVPCDCLQPLHLVMLLSQFNLVEFLLCRRLLGAVPGNVLLS